ncbi:cyclic nucleotide-binding domain-containing protein [Muricauda sp. HICW]|uniref:Cyclic nucleotide-binding domain-containing protein n=1 Tax=Flagellimonas chongwuensis TaxID=2697365 RepID=A0A850NDR4_9FLAO|nr:Crp/Fnr family transcriptional regulator [Allomuricauda chongwuensis]NVN17080.1 cyclic nucleotide-binding domain-containing protein [Allomuricauda chongwuensis]
MEQIRQYFESEFGISRADWEIFSSKLNRYEFPKKSMLVEAGKVENYLSFIEKGIVRLYIPKEDGGLTFGFVFNGAFVSAYDSFLTQKPSEYTVETITDTILWRLGHKELQEVYASSSIGNLIGRKASEELFLKKSKRELSLLRDSAEQRYLNLFEERPELLREIPLKYIASYIGVTPQALSRIRRRIS